MKRELKYEVVESRGVKGEWRAEAIDFDDEGQCYVVLFSGPHAKERAEEYATWKNDVHILEAANR